MNIKTIVNGALCLMLCVTAFQNQVLAAEDGFDASEIKQLRFISRAILKSRANEKKIIEEELIQGRQRLLTAYDSVLELDKFLKSELARVELVIHADSEPSVTHLTLSGINTGSATSIPITKTDKPISKQKNQDSETDKTRRKNKIDQVLSKITALRQQSQSELIPDWKFWRDKTRRDESKKHVAKVLLETEQELATLSVADKPDIKTVEKILKRLELKRPTVSLKDTDPTIQTITKHRSHK